MLFLWQLNMESVIKTLREKNRYTQVQLAKLLGVSRQALIKYENLEQEPQVATVRALSNLFGVSYDCIIDNKFPVDTSEADKERLAQIQKAFPLLREDEKLAVTEMIRIMAKPQESHAVK